VLRKGVSPFDLLYRLEAAVSAARRGVMKRAGFGRPLRVVPYRGFGTLARVRVLARVLEDWGAVQPRLERGVVGGAWASFRRFATAEISGAQVTLRWGSSEFRTISDDEGFVDLEIEPPPDARLGWNRIEIEAEDARHHKSRAVSAEVLLVGSPAFGIISDIDDTIIETNVANRSHRARAMFVSEAWGRRPFEGVRELYELLGAGGQNPIFYVSSSPWNLYDHLEHFFDCYALPKGPFLLRDWGFSRTGFAPDGRHGHKGSRIAEIFSLVPIGFVLCGDSSQEDPSLYLETARRFPGRVQTVLIRKVPMRARRLASFDRTIKAIEAEGVPVLVYEKSEEASTWSVAQPSPEQPVP
jgi:phosphatidate phosphatase APP1